MCIAIVYGSTGGATQDVANLIKEELGLKAELYDISDCSKETFEKHERLIIGTSTWGEGDLQDD